MLSLFCSLTARAPCSGYQSSSLEREWIPHGGKASVEGHVCAIAARQLGATPEADGELSANASPIKAWLNFTRNSLGQYDRAPSSEELAVLSRVSCADGRLEYIEPLHGVARHPLAKVGCQPAEHVRVFGSVPWRDFSLFDLSHLLLYNRCGETPKSPAARNLFYDLGTGTYSGASYKCTRRCEVQRATPDAAFAVGPSIQLFERMYERRCIHFERIWAWEYQKIDQDAYWRSVPAQVAPHDDA
jgi:hypothetical protein